jgi:putative restriction endonuclease
MKAVFDTKPTSIYDDDISQHYHFPRRYLQVVQNAVGDWVVLRRPRADGGNLAYFATARVSAVEPDPTTPGMSYARLSDFLPFDDAVPWVADGRYAEEALRNIPQREVGVYLRGRSVRSISDDDFVGLVIAGLANIFELARATSLTFAPAFEPPGERVKRVVTCLANRTLRDANFRRTVCEAYDGRCSITRLRISDAKGMWEAQGAHIWSVAAGGPDVVQNGIALSATVHWQFDRHLISVSDDYRLLIDTARVPDDYRALLTRHGDRLQLPDKQLNWPHPTYLAKHRQLFESNAGSPA